MRTAEIIEQFELWCDYNGIKDPTQDDEGVQF